jgi:hypothetical protein
MNSDYKAGFEAGIRAAEAVCRTTEKDFEDDPKGAASDDVLINVAYLTSRNISRIIGDNIAALTPEETDA